MNVFLRRSIFLSLICLWAIPFLGNAQTKATTELSTYVDIPVSHRTTSINKDPVITENGKHGVAKYVHVQFYEYDIIYVPQNGFIGVDTFKMFRVSSALGPTYEAVTYIVTVKKSEVVANADFAETSKNLSVDIEVLANDFGSGGLFEIASIPLVNNGTASFEPGSSFITFTPAQDFVGVAQLNYSVCDGFGECDMSTVSIIVVDNELVAGNDTVKIFTKKNQGQIVYVPSGYELITDPENGVFDFIGNTYSPNADFVGSDLMVFNGNNGSQIVIEVEVLDFVEKMYATDDKVFTTPYSSVEFNVLDNDNSTSCFQIETYPQHGQLEETGFPVGALNYVPDRDFEGVDEFTYSIKPPFCAGEAETATVQVYVSNYEPSSSKFFMVTPKRTPLVIGYNIPVNNFGFEVKDQGDFGKAIFLGGVVDTLIYGQRVQGKNIILYIPDEDVLSAVDDFEVEYCLSYNGGCASSKAVKVEVLIVDSGVPDLDHNCIADCVWPGDTNFDGVVNMEDLLSLGMSIGESGYPRANASLDIFYGQFAEDWSKDFEPASINLKHLDTDGDSLVTSIDTMAISKFYGYTHDFTATKIPVTRQTISLVGSIIAYPGDLISLDMYLGNPSLPAIDVYGFTFPFNYNPQFFDPKSLSINFNESSWLAYNSPVLQMARNDLDGFMEAGFTRTNGISASGHGKIGTVNVVVATELEGFRPDEDEFQVDLGGGVGSIANSAGQFFGTKIDGTTITIKLKKEDGSALTPLPISEDLLKVFPNPARHLVNVHLNGMNEFQRVVLHNITGQKVYDTGSLLTNHAQLDVSHLDNGMYFMSVYTEAGVLNKKLEVIKE